MPAVLKTFIYKQCLLYRTNLILITANPCLIYILITESDLIVCDFVSEQNINLFY